jgi:hypothetical protein
MDRRWVAVVLAVALVTAGSLASGGHVLEITLVYPDGRNATWKNSVADDVARDIIARPESVGPKYLTDAKKKLAERRGYTESVYGPDFWKIQQISKWFYVLREPLANRVVASNRPQP